MSMITEQINRLRQFATKFNGFSFEYKLLTDAADTIEELSAKLAGANMERSAAYYNGVWTPVSDHLPEIEEYYKPFWVTILAQDRGKKFYYVRKVTWNQYGKRWEWSNAKAVSDKINIIAWREYDLPAPYQPKGE